MDRARKAFETGRSKSLEHRIRQLKNLERLFVERQKDIAEAAKKDLNKVSGVGCSRLEDQDLRDPESGDDCIWVVYLR